jgi:integrase
MRRRESPIKRRNPSGEIVWMARYTCRDGKRRMAKPTWNGGKGTFKRKADAQRAIDEAYGITDRPDTVGDYFETWLERHPRAERTNATYGHRVSRLTDVPVEGIPLRDWPLHELRRRHTLALVDHMLRNEGRATTGAVGILRSLSAMAEDAITDEVCELNPFKGIRIRANDPRAKKKRRPIRVFSFEEMHCFAKAAGCHEALVRTFTDTGMRLGEILPLRPEDFDGETLQVRRTTHEGQILEGTKTDHGEQSPGRIVPVPATLAWMLEGQIHLNGRGCELLFPSPRGRLRRERTFYRDVWTPTQEATDLDIRPHECRHSYVTHLRAAGVNDADLAEMAGHRVETMLARYTHAVGESFDVVRGAIG